MQNKKFHKTQKLKKEIWNTPKNENKIKSVKEQGIWEC
jgi:hypothetical protein